MMQAKQTDRLPMPATGSGILADKKFTAAPLDYVFDFPRIAAEIHACRDFFVATPPYQWQVDAGLSGEFPFMSESEENYRRIDAIADGRISRKELGGARIFYLRNSTQSDVKQEARFRITKHLSHDSWFWMPELKERIPYAIECIESLPYRTLGLIRAFVCENTFMPTHRDTHPVGEDGRTPYDKSKAVGISLIPETGGVGMLIWDDANRCVREVRGECLLFDDSKWHGVPMTKGTRITIRIFGELDFDSLRLGRR